MPGLPGLGKFVLAEVRERLPVTKGLGLRDGKKRQRTTALTEFIVCLM
jgi:hypothetical protein